MAHKLAKAMQIGETYIDHKGRPRTIIRSARSAENIHLTDKTGNNIFPLDELLEIVLPYQEEEIGNNKPIDTDFISGLSC